jgi:3-dehydroquinate synthase class II
MDESSSNLSREENFETLKQYLKESLETKFDDIVTKQEDLRQYTIKSIEELKTKAVVQFDDNCAI